MKSLSILCLSLLVTVHAYAASQPLNDVTMKVSPSQSRMSLSVELVSETTAVQGWSFGLCHDPTKATIIDAQPADELNFLLFGDPVGYLAYDIAEGADGTHGVYQGVIVGSVDPSRPTPPIYTGPHPDGLPLLHVQYEILAETEVTFCDTLSNPPVPTAFVYGGLSLRPARLEGSVLLSPNYEEELSFIVTPSLSDSVVTVRMYSPTAAIQGWSFALCHWEDKATVVEARPAADLDVLREGDPVDFLHFEIVPGERRAGSTQAVVIDFDSQSYGPFPQGIDLLHVRYAIQSETDVSFCSNVLGDPPVANVVVIRGESYAPPASNMRGAMLVPGSLSVQFIRGDANRDGSVNIGDAISLCRTAAGLGPVPCRDAADVNDNGRIDLADAIYLLMYLFAQGREPASPFPRAGTDLTPEDDLGCER